MAALRPGPLERIVEVSGSHYELGQRLGKACRTQGRRLLASFRSQTLEGWKTTSWEEILAKAAQFRPAAELWYPDYLEEFSGYAEGAELSERDVFAMACHELLEPEAYVRHCTDLACGPEVTADGGVLAAHNEDYTEEDGRTLVLVRARPQGKPGFLAVMYGGLLPTFGLNSAGISITGNAHSMNDQRSEGVPRMFTVRRILAARTISEAMRAALPPDRASNYNNIIADEAGEIFSVEASATAFQPLYAEEGFLVHTNHYLHPAMRRFELDPETLGGSLMRYHRARALLEPHLGEVTTETLMAILRDHAHRPRSICRHPRKGHSPTVASGVIDLSKRRLYFVRGQPCRHAYRPYDLRGAA